MNDWDFTTLAYVWDANTRAIVKGGERLEAMDEEGRQRSLAALAERVLTLGRGLDDGQLLGAAYIMAEDLYKSIFNDFYWTPDVYAYISLTAGVVMRLVDERGLALHYVVDSTQPEANQAAGIETVPAIFSAAGFAVTGPQIMAAQAARQIGEEPDAAVIQRYRELGSQMADLVIARCHQDRRSSAYFNFDLDDDTPELNLEVAISPRNTSRTLLVLRTEAPAPGSSANVFPPSDLKIPFLEKR